MIEQRIAPSPPAPPAPRVGTHLNERADDREKAPTRATTGIDRPLHAALAQLTSGVSPLSLSAAYVDWLTHLLSSPDKQIELATQAVSSAASLLAASIGSDASAQAPAKPPAPDRRFAGAAWKQWPFSVYARNFALTKAWWQAATTGIPGVAEHHEDLVSFYARTFLDALAPANFPPTNPVVLERTVREGGANFVRGARNAVEDWRRSTAGELPAGTQAFRVGRELAITPGSVVFRNELIELIQYTPATPDVYAEPLLIVPAWIMKYYILDLSPYDSLVKYLVDHGHTVFMISWKNPGAADRNLCFDDYRTRGCLAALDAVSAIVPERAIHAVGYCIGGTLLAVTAAAMARDGDRRLKSLTLFAAQTDFSEAGEITLFIDDDEVQCLSDMMAGRGYLEGRQMAAAFALLRASDLIWSPIINDYLLGERTPMIDLMAWNADRTRMPARMHAEYLRRLFLENELAEGRFIAGGRPVSLRDIRVPIFAVSTVTDHVAPWRSVFKIHALTNAEITFVLCNGGHNAGIVNPPGNPARHYQLALHRPADAFVDPDRWQQQNAQRPGSWWPAWQDWLMRHSGPRGPLPRMGAPAAGYAPLTAAPGTYVFAR